MRVWVLTTRHHREQAALGYAEYALACRGFLAAGEPTRDNRSRGRFVLRTWWLVNPGCSIDEELVTAEVTRRQVERLLAARRESRRVSRRAA